jgi:predicted  nucleic acid-binding Zn-ribbon protein
MGVFFGLMLITQGHQVTPMEKVITLLKDLSAKVTAEGAKDAAQYDKFACFCKEQADEKLYSIEKSEAKIADLSAEIKELDTAIAKLNSDISKLSKKISSLEGEIKDKTEVRDKQYAAYKVKAKDMNEAIDACGAAIDALKDSKSSMKGAKVDLVQVTSGLVKAVKQQPLLADAASKVAMFSQLSATGAPKFQYQSNDIIATLEDLLATFKSMKKELDIAEHDENSAFERNKLGLLNEKKFAEQDRAEKEAIVEGKTEKLEAAKSDRDEEDKDKTSDDAFMKELTNECEEKAQLFDARSSTRADELKALNDATTELEKGAVPNFGSNKKLVGLTQKAVKPEQKVSATAASFVQIQQVQHQHSDKEAMLQRVRSFIAGVAEKSHSRVLSALSVKVIVAEDHFVKVRTLIKDLIAKLKADANSEATQKGVCDTGMRKAISDRDEASAKIEVANAKITTATSTKNSLEDEIKTLEGEIADEKKALLEATELRNDDKAENAKNVGMSDEGVESVKLALSILQDFYNKAALAQTGKYTPPNADRDGNTVGDLAPETFDSKYKGSQAESKGIVGILEVILSDFERTNKQAEKDETESKKAFEKLEDDANARIKKKDTRIQKAEGELADAKGEILDQEQALSDGQDLLQNGLEALEGLEAMCVKGEETYEERKKKREDEINALKEAMTILEDWKN